MAPRVGPALKIVLEGQVDSGGTWSTGVWMLTPAGQFSAANCSTFVTGAVGALNTWANDTSGGFQQFAGKAFTLSGMTVYSYGLGQDVAGAMASIEATVTEAGSNMASPVQCSMAISNKGTGTSANQKGRNFLPAAGIGVVTTTGRFIATTIPEIVEAWATLLSGFNAAAAPIDSGALCASGTTQEPTLVVYTDDIPDIQNRRRDKLHSTGTWSAGLS